MVITAEKAKQVFGQVLAQGRGQVEDVRQRRERVHLLTELGELAYRRAGGEPGLDAEFDRLFDAIRALESQADPEMPEVADSVEESDLSGEE